jgi:hypothetical protein
VPSRFSASQPALEVRDPTIGPEEPIDSGSVLAMRDESADGLLTELNEKRRRRRFTPVVGLAVIIGIASLWGSLAPLGQGALLVVAAIAVLATYQVDALRKSTVVMYDLDADATASYQRLVDAVCAIGQANRLWHISSRFTVLDRKYHAGAQSEIKREPTTISLGSAPFVKCNIEVPKVGVGSQMLYFFPDRLLVSDSASVGAVPYSALTVLQKRERFIEAEAVPADARVADRTWKYVNKNGGPDRRFRGNRELPICEYETLYFQSSTGLNELLQASRPGVGDALLRFLHDEGHRPTG